MMNKLILVIEDEKDVREAEIDALENAGFTVLSAENGEIGLQAALTSKPDLILLDIHMPIMDGHAMLQKLRGDPWGSTAKVILATSQSDVENVSEGFSNHIDDYIVKGNISLADMIRKIRETIYH